MNEILQVGKYKGKPVEVLASDPSYTEWLVKQDWFKQKYQHQYNIIINNFCEPNDTPEHNQLQAKFLKDEINAALIRLCFAVPDNCPIQILSKKFEKDGWDVAIQFFIARFCFLPKESGNTWWERTLDKREECEDHFGWGDPPFAEKHYGKIRLVEARLPFSNDAVGVELKPTLGDDYPSVLRQVKRHGAVACKTVVIEHFNSCAVSFEDVQEMFACDNIKLLTLGQIESVQSTVSVSRELVAYR